MTRQPIAATDSALLSLKDDAKIDTKTISSSEVGSSDSGKFQQV
jgi:hypothetical protein